VEKCLQLLNDSQQNILLKMRLRRPFLHVSNTKHISPDFWSCNVKHLERQTKRTTAKLLNVLIADYEGKHFTVEKVSGVEVLKELMDTNGLRQKDLAEDLGGESIVSLILKEKRQLNRQQMEKLSQRFHVSPQFSSSFSVSCLFA
jgi:antitoxin component HigA of HigAB toxin-antitoxin module